VSHLQYKQVEIVCRQGRERSLQPNSVFGVYECGCSRRRIAQQKAAYQVGKWSPKAISSYIHSIRRLHGPAEFTGQTLACWIAEARQGLTPIEATRMQPLHC
jgi:hypothetical protein